MVETVLTWSERRCLWLDRKGFETAFFPRYYLLCTWLFDLPLRSFHRSCLLI